MRHAPALISILVGILPVLWLYQSHGVPTKISVGYGVLVWLVAVLAKVVIYRFTVDQLARRGIGRRTVAFLQGLLSAGTELGIAAGFFYFIWRPETLPELIAIGAGAGMAEAVILSAMRDTRDIFRGTALEEHSIDMAPGMAQNRGVQWFGVLERVFATMVHISGRALVYLSIASGDPVPIAIGVCGFVCVDGIGFYGHLRKWRFDNVRVLSRVEGYLGVVAVAMVGAFVVLARKLDVFA